MRHLTWTAVAVALALGVTDAGGQVYAEGAPLEVRVWLDRGLEPVLRRGDRVRVYYRTSEPAYVAVFHIDTDGVIRLVSPQSPEEVHPAEAGRDYRLLFPRSSYWYVDEQEGKGYFFALASPVPFDFRRLRWQAHQKAWDLQPVGRTVYQDPYVAMDDYVAALLPAWESTAYALDFISYDVDRAHEYPRFLCYDCHGFRSYASWNPYTYACSTFRVVVWDDPYFYPAYRYGPTRVVFATPPRGRARFEFKERAEGEAWSPLRMTRQPERRRPVEYLEPSVAEPERPRIAQPRRRVVSPQETRPSSGSQAQPRSAVEPTPRRNAPSAVRSSPAPARGQAEPARDPSPASGTPARGVTPPTRSAGERPTLQRRPASPVAPGARPSTGRPSSGRPDEPSTRVRPTRVVRPSGGVRPGSARPAPSTRPTTGVRPPAASPGSGVRPSARPTTGRPSVRPSTGRPSARPAPSRPSARPSARPAPSRPPPRPAPRPKRPPPKRPGG